MTTSPTTRSSAVLAAADALVEAASSFVPCPPVRSTIGADDLAAAYAVQRELVARRVARGARVVGRKIGLTSEAVQRQLGVDQPDFGVLLDDMAYQSGDVVPASAVLQPRAEAEIAFVLGADLDTGSLDAAQVRDSVEYAVAAVEICGSRIADWDIRFADTVADNASSGAYVLGRDRLTLDRFEPAGATMVLIVDGVEVSTGTGEACMGDPLEAVSWLARTARELGEPLRAGQVVLSGALGAMYPVGPGSVVTAVVDPLGEVSFTVGGEG